MMCYSRLYKPFRYTYRRPDRRMHLKMCKSILPDESLQSNHLSPLCSRLRSLWSLYDTSRLMNRLCLMSRCSHLLHNLLCCRRHRLHKYMNNGSRHHHRCNRRHQWQRLLYLCMSGIVKQKLRPSNRRCQNVNRATQSKNRKVLFRHTSDYYRQTMSNRLHLVRRKLLHLNRCSLCGRLQPYIYRKYCCRRSLMMYRCNLLNRSYRKS